MARTIINKNSAGHACCSCPTFFTRLVYPVQLPNMDSQAIQASQLPEGTEIDRMVAEVIQYFLIMEQKKFPVKKIDITKLLALKGNSMKTFKAIMSKSGEFLENVFGYKIHEFEEKSGHFVLVNTVSHGGKLSNPQNAQEDSVLFLILAAIYLAEGEIAEEDTWSMLDNLGLLSEDIKKKIQQDFIRQMYLVMDAIPATDPPKFKFLWGERAKLEFTKMEILEFAREIYGFPIENFGSLYSNALKEQGGKEN